MSLIEVIKRAAFFSFHFLTYSFLLCCLLFKNLLTKLVLPTHRNVKNCEVLCINCEALKHLHTLLLIQPFTFTNLCSLADVPGSLVFVTRQDLIENLISDCVFPTALINISVKKRIEARGRQRALLNQIQGINGRHSDILSYYKRETVWGAKEVSQLS